ncbi:MAG: leucine-rich repeat domain-containing protein, partial [Promethearchaeota archaeon]
MNDVMLSLHKIDGRNTSFEFDADRTRLGLGHLMISELDLTPLQECRNLEILSLFSNYLSRIDLRPLSECSKLRALRLGINCLKDVDLEPLTECRALESLDLGANRLTRINLSPLEVLTQLRRVRLDGNRVTKVDLSPLESCTELEFLDFTLNELTEIDLWPLVGCLQLKKLSLWGNRLKRVDVSPLMLIGDQLNLDKDCSTSVVVHPDASEFTTAERRRVSTTYEFPVGDETWKKLRRTIIKFIEKNSQSRAIRFQRILFRLLGMEELGFYDGPLGDLWTDISETLGLTETRQALYDRMIEFLERQLENGGSSMFADMERLAITRGCKLIPKMLEQRSKEMEDITISTEGHYADVSPLWLTSYGYAFLKSLGVDSTTVTTSMLARIRQGLGKAGIKVRITESKPESEGSRQVPNRSMELLDYVLNS